MRVRIGCCGLAGLSLSKYADIFDALEINSTFYRLPRKETAERWFQTTRDRTVLCMKSFQGVTHPVSSPTWRRVGPQRPTKMVGRYGHLQPTKENMAAWERTLEICEAMRARVCVVQTPPSFICTDRSVRDALKFFRMVRRPAGVAIELRHGSWAENPAKTKKLIAGADLIHVTDPLKQEPISGGRICYYRLHGLGSRPYKYDYTDEDLRRLRDAVLGIGCETAYVMFNNLAMRRDALRFRKMIR